MGFPFIAAGVAVGIGTVAGALGGTAYLVTQDGEGKIQKPPKEPYEIPDPDFGKQVTLIGRDESKEVVNPYNGGFHTTKSYQYKDTKGSIFTANKTYDLDTGIVNTDVYHPNGSISSYRSDRRNSGYAEFSRNTVVGGRTKWQPIGGKATPKPNLGKGVKLTEVKTPNAPLGEKVYKFYGGTVTTKRKSAEIVETVVTPEKGTPTTYANNLQTGAVWANTGNETFQVTLSKKEKQQQQKAMNKLKKDGKEFAKNSIATGKRLSTNIAQFTPSRLYSELVNPKKANQKTAKQRKGREGKGISKITSKTPTSKPSKLNIGVPSVDTLRSLPPPPPHVR
jgi:hypothetical protein